MCLNSEQLKQNCLTFSHSQYDSLFLSATLIPPSIAGRQGSKRKRHAECKATLCNLIEGIHECRNGLAGWLQ